MAGMIAADKRTELHMLTNMSDYTGLISIRDILNESDPRADLNALAITDINSVQSFPAAAHETHYGKEHEVRLLYGLTATVVRSGEETPCMLIAGNIRGKDNLFRLVTEAYKLENEGKTFVTWEYQQDRISFPESAYGELC